MSTSSTELPLIGFLGSSRPHSPGPTPLSLPGCDRLSLSIIVASSRFLIIPDGRAPQHGSWWLIKPGQWAIRVELFSLWVDARADRKSTRLNSSHSQISYAV